MTLLAFFLPVWTLLLSFLQSFISLSAFKSMMLARALSLGAFLFLYIFWTTSSILMTLTLNDSETYFYSADFSPELLTYVANWNFALAVQKTPWSTVQVKSLSSMPIPPHLFFPPEDPVSVNHYAIHLVAQDKNLNIILDSSISLIPKIQSTTNPADPTSWISLQPSNFSLLHCHFPSKARTISCLKKYYG